MDSGVVPVHQMLAEHSDSELLEEAMNDMAYEVGSPCEGGRRVDVDLVLSMSSGALRRNRTQRGGNGN